MGGRSATTDQDIQLHGLGILPEHCVITIEESGLYMTPLNGARCFVNGSQVVAKTPLLHGDRIVWGNHHFFRVNCPRSATGNYFFYYFYFSKIENHISSFIFVFVYNLMFSILQLL